MNDYKREVGTNPLTLGIPANPAWSMRRGPCGPYRHSSTTDKSSVFINVYCCGPGTTVWTQCVVVLENMKMKQCTKSLVIYVFQFRSSPKLH